MTSSAQNGRQAGSNIQTVKSKTKGKLVQNLVRKYSGKIKKIQELEHKSNINSVFFFNFFFCSVGKA